MSMVSCGARVLRFAVSVRNALEQAGDVAATRITGTIVLPKFDL